MPTASFVDVDPRDPDAAAALAAYFDELDERFESGFDGAAETAEQPDAFRPAGGTFVLIRTDDEIAGCGAVRTLSPGVGEIKRMWVAPGFRGVGLGRRLLRELETRSRELGHQRVRLDTNEALDEALALYQRAGYEPISRYNDNPYAHHWLEKTF